MFSPALLLRRSGSTSTSAQSVRGRRTTTTVYAMSSSDSKKKVLFVCLGNICRSPTAEAMFRAVLEKNGLADKFEIDSCGTGGGSSNWYKVTIFPILFPSLLVFHSLGLNGTFFISLPSTQPGGFSYHEGDASDPRMLRTAAKRGVKLTSFSRPLRPRDLSK